MSRATGIPWRVMVNCSPPATRSKSCENGSWLQTPRWYHRTRDIDPARGTIESLLRGILRILCRSKIRDSARQHRRRVRDVSIAYSAGTEGNESSLCEGKIYDALACAINRLENEKHRTMMEMVLAGHSNIAIASAFGVSPPKLTEPMTGFSPNSGSSSLCHDTLS